MAELAGAVAGAGYGWLLARAIRALLRVRTTGLLAARLAIASQGVLCAAIVIWAARS